MKGFPFSSEHDCFPMNEALNFGIFIATFIVREEKTTRRWLSDSCVSVTEFCKHINTVCILYTAVLERLKAMKCSCL